MKNTHPSLVPEERIVQRIFILHGKKIMLDRDLARLCGVKSIALRQQVKRNLRRFPDDFMFQVSENEACFLVSQNVIPSKRSFGGFLPYVFTEQGVAMLSSVLKSEQAIEMNIQIMRIFTKIRGLLSTHEELRLKIQEMEKRYDKKFSAIFRVIQHLLAEDEKPKNEMGFRERGGK